MILSSLKTTIIGSRRGIRDVLILMIPQGVRVVTGFFTSVFIARGLGPTGLGHYALVMSLSETATSLSDLGIGQTAIRFASRAAAQGDKAGHLAVIRWAFRMRLLLVLLITAIIFALAPTLANKVWQIEGLAPLLRLGLLIGIFSALASLPIVYYQSIKRFGMNSTVLTGQAFILFSGILILAWLNHWSVYWVITVSILATAFGAFLFLLFIPKEALFPRHCIRRLLAIKLLDLLRTPKTSSSVDKAIDNSNLSTFAIYNLLATVIVLITLRVDVWLIGYFLDSSQIGLYIVAMRVTLPLTILLNAITTALWPRASALVEVDQIKRLLKKAFQLGVPLSFLALLYATIVPLLVPVIFGDKYLDSVLISHILCARFGLTILFNPIGVIGYSMGIIRYYWMVNLLQFVVVVAINIILMPRIGLLAPVSALVANTIVGTTIIGFLIWHKVRSYS